MKVYVCPSLSCFVPGHQSILTLGEHVAYCVEYNTNKALHVIESVFTIIS